MTLNFYGVERLLALYHVAKVKRTLRGKIKKLTKTAEFSGCCGDRQVDPAWSARFGFIWALRVSCGLILFRF
jgi:hypothetical protein